MFRSAKRTILYIGKALNLRRRIASYGSQYSRQPAKVRRLMARARAVTIEETGSELEALLLESRLLKRETPPFNQVSTHYAAPPFVKLTLTEPFPRLLLTRQFAVDGDVYLGPFPRYDIAEAVLTALQRLFPVRTCEGPIAPGVSPSPCSAWHVKKCAGPCVSAARAAVYRHHIAQVLALLVRGREAIVQGLLAERQRAAEALLFERASHIHALLVRFDEATLGRPLAFIPVAQRHLAVCFERDQQRASEVFLIRDGLFAGRVVLEGPPHTYKGLKTALLCWYGETRHRHVSGGDEVVDELRLVAGWLHRTRQHARWVRLDPEMTPTEELQAVIQAIASHRG
jgi:excinuclease UvrABC nuclease subunit